MTSSHSKVLVIELFTGGATPYGDISLDEVLQRVGAGERLQKPSSMPTTTYLLMMTCWDVDPAARPSFSQLHQTLSQNEGSEDSWQLRELDGRASGCTVYGDGRSSATSLLEMMPAAKLNTMDRLEREILSNISAPPRRASTSFDTGKSSFFTGAYAHAHATKKPKQKNNKVGPDLPLDLPAVSTQAPRLQPSASVDGAGASSAPVQVLPTVRPALLGMQPPTSTVTDCDHESAGTVVVEDAVYAVPDRNATTADRTYSQSVGFYAAAF